MLSIVIPSRNRQKYIVCAVRAALERKEIDIEIIVADNSDDKKLINLFLNNYLNDKRLKILESPEIILSMRENWERGLNATQGEWVSFIGDDDLIDPSLKDFLNILEKNSPQTDILTWEKPNYIWPDLVSDASRVASIPIGDECKNLIGFKILEILYQWNNTRNPGGGASIYHGAFKRNYINKIKKMRDGVFFKYETVDFDAGYTALIFASNIALSRRPFSINGASVSSNSGAVNLYDKHIERTQQWMTETPKGYDGSDICPINSSLCISTIVYAFQLVFAKDHNLKFNIDPKSIINAMNIDLAYEKDRRHFEQKRKNIYDNLSKSDWSIYLDLFSPKFLSRQTPNPLRGIYRNRFYIEHDFNNSKNIYDFYKNTFWILFKSELVGRDFNVSIE